MWSAPVLDDGRLPGLGGGPEAGLMPPCRGLGGGIWRPADAGALEGVSATESCAANLMPRFFLLPPLPPSSDDVEIGAKATPRLSVRLR